MRALLLELDGRLDATLPVRPLVPAVGLLLTVGLLVLVRLVLLPTRPEEAVPVVGRLVMLPATLPLLFPSTLARPDMLPPVLPPWLPLLGRRELIDPLLPVLPCLTLAT